MLKNNIYLLIMLIVVCSCKSESNTNILFSEAENTNITFNNVLDNSEDFHVTLFPKVCGNFSEVVPMEKAGILKVFIGGASTVTIIELVDRASLR